MMEKIIYKSDTKNFLLFIISITSNEKVEKVVKEPKIPIIIKYIIMFEDIFLFSIKLIR